jgi:hypothetical protein
LFKDIIVNLSAGKSGKMVGDYAISVAMCAIYSEGAAGGGTNCGFTSFEQCMETARGLYPY